MKFKSRDIVVEATQFSEDTYESLKHLIDKTEYTPYKEYGYLGYLSYDLKENLGGNEISIGDWIVQFQNGQVHVIQDKQFQQIFEADNEIHLMDSTRDFGDIYHGGIN